MRPARNMSHITGLIWESMLGPIKENRLDEIDRTNQRPISTFDRTWLGRNHSCGANQCNFMGDVNEVINLEQISRGARKHMNVAYLHSACSVRVCSKYETESYCCLPAVLPSSITHSMGIRTSTRSSRPYHRWHRTVFILFLVALWHFYPWIRGVNHDPDIGKEADSKIWVLQPVRTCTHIVSLSSCVCVIWLCAYAIW